MGEQTECLVAALEHHKGNAASVQKHVSVTTPKPAREDYRHLGRHFVRIIQSGPVSTISSPLWTKGLPRNRNRRLEGPHILDTERCTLLHSCHLSSIAQTHSRIWGTRLDSCRTCILFVHSDVQKWPKVRD